MAPAVALEWEGAYGVDPGSCSVTVSSSPAAGLASASTRPRTRSGVARREERGQPTKRLPDKDNGREARVARLHRRRRRRGLPASHRSACARCTHVPWHRGRSRRRAGSTNSRSRTTRARARQARAREERAIHRHRSPDRRGARHRARGVVGRSHTDSEAFGVAAVRAEEQRYRRVGPPGGAPTQSSSRRSSAVSPASRKMPASVPLRISR